MARKDYMPLDDPGKAALFLHVKNTLPSKLAELNPAPLTPQQAGLVSQQAADALAFDYQCRAQQTLVAAAQSSTAAKNRLRDGDPASPNSAVSLAFPLAPGAVPSPVTPGVVRRFRDFAKWIKSLPGYTDGIGEALMIVGDEETAADLTTVKPILPLKLDGGRVEIGWGWEGLRGQVDAIEIQVDRGTGTFTLLTIDTRPGYIDTEPFPGNAKWKYKAIWRKDDQRTGQWSDVTEISVG